MAHVVLVEIKPGIDIETSSLVTDINEYYLFDGSGVAIATGFTGAISGNHLTANGTVLEVNDSGTTSVCFEWDGTILQVKT